MSNLSKILRLRDKGTLAKLATCATWRKEAAVQKKIALYRAMDKVAKQAGFLEDVTGGASSMYENYLAPAGAKGLEMGGAALDAVGNYMTAPTADDLMKAAAEGREAATLGSAGRFLSPRAPFQQQPSFFDKAERLISDPYAQRVGVGAAAGVGLGALGMHLLNRRNTKQKEQQEREVRDRVRSELEQMGIKVSSIQKLAEGGWLDRIKEKASELGSNAGDLMSQAGGYLQAKTDGSQAMSSLKGKAGYYYKELREALNNPEKRVQATALIGSVLGGTGGLAAEALSGKERKQYLRSLMLGGVGGGIAGASYGALFDPNDPNATEDGKPRIRTDYLEILQNGTPEQRAQALEELRNSATESLLPGLATNPYAQMAGGAATGVGVGRLADHQRWYAPEWLRNSRFGKMLGDEGNKTWRDSLQHLELDKFDAARALDEANAAAAAASARPGSQLNANLTGGGNKAGPTAESLNEAARKARRASTRANNAYTTYIGKPPEKKLFRAKSFGRGLAGAGIAYGLGQIVPSLFSSGEQLPDDPTDMDNLLPTSPFAG